MKYLNIFLLIIGLLMVVSGQASPLSNADEALCHNVEDDINAYVDKALQITETPNPDEVFLPMLMNTEHNLFIYSGSLKEISALKRKGPVSINCNQETSTISLEGGIDIEKASLLYNYQYEYRNYSYNPSLIIEHGTVEMKMKDFEALVRVIFTNSTDEMSLKLTSLKLKNVKDIEANCNCRPERKNNPFAPANVKKYTGEIIEHLEKEFPKQMNALWERQIRKYN